MQPITKRTQTISESARCSTAIAIRAFRPGDGGAFALLNRRWIEEVFGMEEEDRRVLNSPDTAILEPGGYIAMAQLAGEIVGTGALMIPHGEHSGSNWLDLVKMATSPSAQGKGVGGAVLDHLITIARKRGAEAIWLETNDKLATATRLYARKGFRALSQDEENPTPYSRCNLQMVLTL